MRHAASLMREQFMSDEKSQDAVSKCVSKCISNVGEAANKALKLDPTIKEQFPEFEAEKACAARNVISHDYFAPSTLCQVIKCKARPFKSTHTFSFNMRR